MSNRKRVNRSLPLMEFTEKLLTKKEVEANARLHMTCPVLQKKHFSPIGTHKLLFSTQEARVLSFDKPAQLSPKYNPSIKKTYFAQMYKIQDTLGEGSFGVVYKVVSRENDEDYAVKITKKGYLSKNNYEEIRLLEKIGNHQNIVKFYFAWEEMSRVFTQLELCALSLDTYSKTNHSISENQLWDILIDMVQALNHLHDRKLIHLDIKPENIMMSTDGIYKLGDFDLLFDVTKTEENQNKFDITEGDAKYLAKEVLEGKVTPAADIFSLGITMLELATDLVLPVNGPLWQRLRNGSYDDPCFTLVPKKLKSLICKMMGPKPHVRPKAKQILSSAAVKENLLAKTSVPRFNYYETWKANVAETMDREPVAVCINAQNEMNMDVANMEVETTPCVTPPKKVSRVIIYNM